MEFAQVQLGLSFEKAGGLLIEFRKFREKTSGKSQGPTRSNDWVMPKGGKK